MKQLLEKTFDIPFSVSVHSDGYWFCPKNDYRELFDVTISNKTGVRIVTEILPQAHSGNMLEDMSKADEQQRSLFNNYLELLRNTSKVEIGINGHEVNTTAEWPNVWRNFYIRVTRILNEDEKFDNAAKEHAVLVSGMLLSLLKIVPIDGGYEEGRKTQITTNKYERNPLNRELCLAAKGYSCCVCGFNFEKKYGLIGKDFIHVHHIVPVSQMGGSYIIDPTKDLVPICPNCHAMLHTRELPLTPDELKNIIDKEAKHE